MNKEEIEKLFLSFLGSGEKLKWQLDNNINLVDYFEKNNPLFPLFKGLVSFYPNKTTKQEAEKITGRGILILLQKERPDLYERVIRYPNGLKWLEEQIKNFKNAFLR